MITVKVHGDFKRTSKFFEKLQDLTHLSIYDKYGKLGVEALAQATPKDTGKTASSWYYEIERKNGGVTITWNNSNVNKGVSIAMILQYGHGTRNGGYVTGTDYINPALRPIFEELADSAWEEVTRA